jgi:hypothetical protein
MVVIHQLLTLHFISDLLVTELNLLFLKAARFDILFEVNDLFLMKLVLDTTLNSLAHVEFDLANY